MGLRVAVAILSIALFALCTPLTGIGAVKYLLKRNLRDGDGNNNASGRCRCCVVLLLALTFLWALLATATLVAILAREVDLNYDGEYEWHTSGIGTITVSEIYNPLLYQTPTYLLVILIPSREMIVTVFAIVAAAFDLTTRFAADWRDGVLGWLPVIVFALFPICYVWRRDIAVDDTQPNEAQLPQSSDILPPHAEEAQSVPTKETQPPPTNDTADMQ